MPIDLGNNPVGATPTIQQAAQMCTALKVGSGNDVTFNKVGIGLGATGPIIPLDINGNQMCIRQPFTPSIGATSPAGTMCWDEVGRLYVKTGLSGWKYVELEPMPGYIGSTGSFSLLNSESPKSVEYIPFLATSEKLIITVTITADPGATGPPVIVLGSAYTPFVYEIISTNAALGAGATLNNPNTDSITFEQGSPGDSFIISLKVGDSYLSAFTPDSILTPGNTLSAVVATTNTFDLNVTFEVTAR
jgi:hypothetical protein